MINVLLVDDQKVIVEQLKSYFEPEADLQVVGTAENSIEALEKIKALQPHVVLMDVEMPGGISGLEMTSMISNLYPEIKVIILTGNYTEEYGKQAVRVGAGAYLSKSTSAKQLTAAVKEVCQANHLVAQANATPKVVSYFHSDQTLSQNNSKPQPLATEATPRYSQPKKAFQPKLSKFLSLGVFFNSLVWVLALGYLKLTPPTYTSQWGVKILETNSGVEVVLPDGSKANPVSGGWTPATDQDPRNDYVYIGTSPDLLTEAAKLVNMTVEEYRKPKIEVDEANGIIALSIDGSSAEEARAKARAFHQTMIQQIESLRTTELARQEAKTQATLVEAKEKLVAAQNKLSQYRAKSGISTDGQINSLTDNIENLRRQKAELAVQQVGLGDRYKQLNRDINNLAAFKTNVMVREALQQDLINNRAEWQGLKAQNQELSAQIDILEARLRNMSQGQLEIDSLQRDLQVAETVFATTLAKLDWVQENIYSIYPLLQLVTQPNLPEKPSNPNPDFIHLVGLAGSFLVTTSLVLLWFEQKKSGFEPLISRSRQSLSSSPSVFTI